MTVLPESRALHGVGSGSPSSGLVVRFTLITRKGRKRGGITCSNVWLCCSSSDILVELMERVEGNLDGRARTSKILAKFGDVRNFTRSHLTDCHAPIRSHNALPSMRQGRIPRRTGGKSCLNTILILRYARSWAPDARYANPEPLSNCLTPVFTALPQGSSLSQRDLYPNTYIAAMSSLHVVQQKVGFDDPS